MLYYGFDISTSIIGVATFNEAGEFGDSYHIDLRKTDGILAKATEFNVWVNTFVHQGHCTFFVEERLGGFSGGRTSAQVLMKLGAFNAVCSYILYSSMPGTFRSVVHLHPSTWKATMKHHGLIIPKGAENKKELTVAFVQRKEPKFAEFIQQNLNKNGNPQPWVTDCADAYCIGKAGYTKLCNVKDEK